MILCIENSKEKKTTKTIRINRKVQQGYRIQDTYIKINCFLYCAVCVHRRSVMCQTLCNPMDCSPPDSLVQEDSLGNPLEWVAHALLQGIFQPRDQAHVSRTAVDSLYHLNYQGSQFSTIGISNQKMKLRT